jgi:hypothetical protein
MYQFLRPGELAWAPVSATGWRFDGVTDCQEMEHYEVTDVFWQR